MTWPAWGSEAVTVVPGATIDLEDDADRPVGAGDVVRLQAGKATTWVVTERLRKNHLTWGT